MTAHEFLQSVRDDSERYEEQMSRLAELNAICTKTTAAANGVAVSGGGDSHKDDSLIHLADEREKLRAVTDCLDSRRHAAAELIEEMPTTEFRWILSARYLSCMPWRGVHRTLLRKGYSYSSSSLFRRHKAAIAEAQSVWESRGSDYQ